MGATGFNRARRLAADMLGVSFESIGYTEAIAILNDPDANKLYLMEPLPEEIEEFNTVHPALALLNAATTVSELTVLPSVGKARASEILALRVAPWDSLDSAQQDLSGVSIDWDAIASWEG